MKVVGTFYATFTATAYPFFYSTFQILSTKKAYLTPDLMQSISDTRPNAFCSTDI